jgi:hypothetical protein
LLIAVLKAWIVIIEVKLKMSWLLTIFFAKWPYVVIDLAVCTKGIYMPLFFMLAVALSWRQYREVKEKWPLKNLMLFQKCLASASLLDQSLISSSDTSSSLSLTFPSRQQNLRGSCSNLFALQCLQFATGFSIWVYVGKLLYTFSYWSDTSGTEVVSSSGSLSWTSSSSSSPKMIIKAQ